MARSMRKDGYLYRAVVTKTWEADPASRYVHRQVDGHVVEYYGPYDAEATAAFVGSYFARQSLRRDRHDTSVTSTYHVERCEPQWKKRVPSFWA